MSSVRWVLLVAVLFYVLFMVSRAARLFSIIPLSPSEEYLSLLDQFRLDSKHIDPVLANTTYLVIGGTGFTGSALVDDLRKRGAKKVKIMGRSFPPSLEYPYGFKKENRYPLPGVDYVRGDVTDVAALKKAMEGVNVVFHTAVLYGTPSFGSQRGAQITENVNIQGMKNIYEAAKQAKTVKQIIYTSSADTVFPGRNIELVNETHPYAALGIFDQQYAEGSLAVGDHYARTKIIAEKFLLSMDNKDGIRTAALRPNGIYGPGEHSAFVRIINPAFVLGGLPFYFDEHQKSDWTCVYNLVYAHVLATYVLATSPAQVGGKAYFITDEDVSNNAAYGIFKPAVESAAGPVKLWLKIPPSILLHFGYYSEMLEKFLYEKFGVTLPLFITHKEALKVLITHTYSNKRARLDLGYKPLLTTPQCQKFAAEECGRKYNSN